MHARLPPEKVMLDTSIINQHRSMKRGDRRDTHVPAKTPGKCASATVLGSGSSHLSGLHMSASGPQIALSRLTAPMPMMMFWLYAIGISRIIFPSVPITGCMRGKTSARRALSYYQFRSP